jgi:flagellar export protein FliJ
MRRFKFRFEAVEKVRRTREQQVLRLLGSAQRDLEGARSRKRKLQDSLAKAQSEREKLGSVAVTVAEFALADDYIRGTERRILQADHSIAKAERAYEKAKRVYLLALRQLRAIETLREKHLAEWKREVSKKEQKAIDDLVSTRASFLKEEEAETA